MAKINMQPGGTPKPPVIPQVPAPAKMPPGISSGMLPLPVGRPVTLLNASGVTEGEKKQLRAVGWTEGEPIPSNMAEIVASVVQAAQADQADALNAFPVDPSTPPTKLKTVPIEKLKPEQQAQIRQMMLEATNQAKAVVPPTSDVANTIAGSQMVETVAAAPVRPAPAGNVAPDVNYRPAAEAVNPKAKPKPAEPAVEYSGGTESAVAPMTHCGHCGWDLAVSSIPEPDERDKQAYLQSILGEKVFVREYELFGGKLLAAFRVLTTREIDAIYAQAYRERDSQRLSTPMDFIERVNRLRLFLQLQRLRTVDRTGFDHEMPDGLSRAVNAKAETCWEFDAGEREPLLLIENTVLNTVLTNETLNRIVQQQCGRFNQLVARLEATVDNPDFWKATASQS